MRTMILYVSSYMVAPLFCCRSAWPISHAFWGSDVRLHGRQPIALYHMPRAESIRIRNGFGCTSGWYGIADSPPVLDAQRLRPALLVEAVSSQSLGDFLCAQLQSR